MNSGWDYSAEAWITLIGSEGDFSRTHVLDRPMLAQVAKSGASTALDVGCGEGRFCRMMAQSVPKVTGIDPTPRLLDEARRHGGAAQRYNRAPYLMLMEWQKPNAEQLESAQDG